MKTKQIEIFETVSFHLVKPCNMSCKFCYATYNSFKVGKQLSLDDVVIILYKLYEAGVEKVTFAGGEPMLHKDIDEIIIAAKKIGLTTSIITNGYLINKTWLNKMSGHLDWIGVSIDSINPKTNAKIGRRTNRDQDVDYFKLITLINSYQTFKLKINTVVNTFNEKEDMKTFIEYAKPVRWKVFDTLRVEGQNATQFNEIKSNDFNGFIINNRHELMVVETNELMTGSYLLIDPLGRFYENWGADTRKSDSLVTHSVEHCLNQISLDRDKFIARGGIYNWD